MALYLNTETGQYPLHDGDIEGMFHYWKPGRMLPTPFVQVESVDHPGETEDLVTYEGQPVLVAGKYKMNWETRPMTDAEKAMRDTPLPEDATYKPYQWNYETSAWEETHNNGA